jgi:hypothetical protein
MLRDIRRRTNSTTTSILYADLYRAVTDLVVSPGRYGACPPLLSRVGERVANELTPASRPWLQVSGTGRWSCAVAAVAAAPTTSTWRRAGDEGVLGPVGVRLLGRGALHGGRAHSDFD